MKREGARARKKKETCGCADGGSEDAMPMQCDEMEMEMEKEKE